MQEDYVGVVQKTRKYTINNQQQKISNQTKNQPSIANAKPKI
jgi:hypothetical protein